MISHAAAAEITGLRLAGPADFDQVYELYMDEKVLPQVSFRKTDKPAFFPVFQKLIAAPGLYVYEREGRILAAYKITRLDHRLDHIAHLGSLGVTGSHQGKGIGKLLMRHELDRLKADGVRRVQLFVLKNNEAGVRFYQSLGFEVEGELRAYCQATDSDELLPELVMSILF